MLLSARSEEGSLRDEIPQAGLRAAALTFLSVERESKNRSGAEGDYCDSDNAAFNRLE